MNLDPVTRSLLLGRALDWRDNKPGEHMPVMPDDLLALLDAADEADEWRRLMARPHAGDACYETHQQAAQDSCMGCERDAALARIARVEAVLADEWVDEPPSATYPQGRRLYRWPAGLRDDLLRALTTGDDPQPEAVEALSDVTVERALCTHRYCYEVAVADGRCHNHARGESR